MLAADSRPRDHVRVAPACSLRVIILSHAHDAPLAANSSESTTVDSVLIVGLLLEALVCEVLHDEGHRVDTHHKVEYHQENQIIS